MGDQFSHLRCVGIRCAFETPLKILLSRWGRQSKSWHYNIESSEAFRQLWGQCGRPGNTWFPKAWLSDWWHPGLDSGLVPSRLLLQLDITAPCTTPTSPAPSWALTAGRRVCHMARSLASQIASTASLLLKTRAFCILLEMQFFCSIQARMLDCGLAPWTAASMPVSALVYPQGTWPCSPSPASSASIWI